MKIEVGNIIIYKKNDLQFTGIVSKIFRKKFLFIEYSNPSYEVYSLGNKFVVKHKDVLFIYKNEGGLI